MKRFFSFVLGPLKRRLEPDAVMWLRRRGASPAPYLLISFWTTSAPSDTARSRRSVTFRRVHAACCRGLLFIFLPLFFRHVLFFLFQVYCSSLQRSRTWPKARVEEMKYLWVFLFVAIEILKFFPVAAATKHDGHVPPFVFHPASIKTVGNSNNIQGFLFLQCSIWLH